MNSARRCATTGGVERRISNRRPIAVREHHVDTRKIVLPYADDLGVSYKGKKAQAETMREACEVP